MILIVRFLKPAGMALYPFILVNAPDLKNDQVLIFHERIHLRQQKELLVLPFYLLYLAFYLRGLWQSRNHQAAYRQIPFEREAYRHEQDFGYLNRRPFWGWINFI